MATHDERSNAPDQAESSPSPHASAPAMPMLQAAAGHLGRGVLQRKLQRRAAERAARMGMAEPAAGGLPAPLQAKMEASFGTDLSPLRVHVDDSPGELGAIAYAKGTDLHFKPGTYNPDTVEGQEVIGHEVAHAIQQAHGRASANVQGKGAPIGADPGLEREADEQGARAARGEPAGCAPADLTGAAGGGVIQRMPEKDLRQGRHYLVYWKGSQVPALLLSIAPGCYEVRVSGEESSVFLDNSEEIIMELASHVPERDRGGKEREKVDKKASGSSTQRMDVDSGLGTPPPHRAAEGAVLDGPPTTVVAVGPTGPYAVVSDELVAAYLADTAGGAFLQEPEGQLIARQLDVRAQVMSQLRGHLIQANNIAYGDAGAGHQGILLHVGGNHYIVIQRRLPGPGGTYFDLQGHAYDEVMRTLTDGNCLIHGLHIIRHGANAGPDQIQALRNHVRDNLNPDLVEPILSAVIMGYLHGTAADFPGVGARTRAYLRRDPNLEVQRLEIRKKKEAEKESSRKRGKKAAPKKAAPKKAAPEKGTSEGRKGPDLERSQSLSKSTVSDLSEEVAADSTSESDEALGTYHKGDPVRFRTGREADDFPHKGTVIKVSQSKKGEPIYVVRPARLTRTMNKNLELSEEHIIPDERQQRDVDKGVDKGTFSQTRASEVDASALKLGHAMSPLTPALLQNPLPMAPLLINSGMHSTDAFQRAAQQRGHELDRPGSESRTTGVSATNSFSAHMSIDRMLGAPQQLTFHPTTRGAEPRTMDLDGTFQNARLDSDTAKKSLTDFHDTFHRQQVKLPKPKAVPRKKKGKGKGKGDGEDAAPVEADASRKRKLRELGMEGAADRPAEASFAPPLDRRREPMHTEAQAYHGDVFTEHLKDSVAALQSLGAAFGVERDAEGSASSAGLENGAMEAELGSELGPDDDIDDLDKDLVPFPKPEPMDADDEAARQKRIEAGDLPPEYYDFLGLGLERQIGVPINRSSCTSHSGYGGGCAQEGVDTAKRFDAYARSQLGPTDWGFHKAMGSLQLHVSFAGRDTNASDDTVHKPVAEGIGVGVHPQFDAERGGVKSVDPNQLAAMRLIDESQRQHREKRVRSDAEPKKKPTENQDAFQKKSADGQDGLAQELWALLHVRGHRPPVQTAIQIARSLAMRAFAELAHGLREDPVPGFEVALASTVGEIGAPHQQDYEGLAYLFSQIVLLYERHADWLRLYWSRYGND